jgi:hypothetical protein
MFLADRIGWPGRRASAGATKSPQRSVSNLAVLALADSTQAAATERHVFL